MKKLEFNIDEFIDKDFLEPGREDFPGYERDKCDIYHLYQSESDPQKRIKELKEMLEVNEYGSSFFNDPDAGIFVDKDSTHYTMKLWDTFNSYGERETLAQFTWDEFEERIGERIRNGEYLNKEELLRYQENYPDAAINANVENEWIPVEEIEKDPEQFTEIFDKVSRNKDQEFDLE